MYFVRLYGFGLCHVRSRILKRVECFVGVPDEGQAHLGVLLWCCGFGLRSVDSACVFLWDLVNREIRHVDVAG